MPLRKALLEAPLSSGLGQKTDIRSLQVDGAAVMTNCVRAKSGSIHKRFGCKQLSNTMVRPVPGGSITLSEIQAVRGLNYGHSPLLLDRYIFSQYSDVESQWTLIDATPEAVALDRIPVASILAGVGLFQATDFDFCPALNLYVIINSSAFGVGGVGGNSIDTIVVDGSNNAVVQPALVIASTTGVNHFLLYPKVIVCGTTAIAAWIAHVGVTAGTITISKLDLTNIAGGWSAPASFATVQQGLFVSYDITPMVGDPTRFAVAYFSTAGTANTTFVTVLASSFAVVHTFTNAAAGTGDSISIVAASGQWCWLAQVFDNGATFAASTWAFNDATNAQIAALLIASVVVGIFQIVPILVNSTDAVVFWTQQDSSGPAIYSVRAQQVTATAGGNTVGAIRRTNGVAIGSRPVTLTTPYGVRCYCMLTVVSALQGTNFLACFDFFGTGALPFGSNGASDVPARLVATVAPRLSKLAGVTSLLNMAISLPKLVAPTATSLVALTLTSTSPQRAALYMQPFDFVSQQLFFGDVLSGSAALGVNAGAPFTFDGQSPSEMGFLWYPEAISVTASGVGPLTGVFGYIITYEWSDSLGNIHRSATSPPTNVTLASNNAVLVLPTLGITWRQRHAPTRLSGQSLFQNAGQNVKICVYRTAAGGTTYFPYAQLDNDTSVSSITYTDAGGGGLVGAALLYTTGGVLDNYCPPSSRICIVHKNRWFLSGCDDPTVVWPSKAFTSGEIPGFNEQMNFYASGAVTALASLDEKLIIFVKRGARYGIEYIIGEGPFDTGAGNNWTDPPQPLPHAVGAIDQRSIAICELGVFFFSPVGGTNGQGGIFLLSRDLQVTYVSGAVEDTIAAFPICTGAAVHPNAGRIYFEFSANDTLVLGTLGRRLVYDYLAQCWSTDTHYQFNGAFDGAAARTTFLAGGQGVTGAGSVNMPLIHWVDYAGQVYRESSGFQGTNSFLDVSVGGTMQWITSAFTSAWFKPALSGFARFWRLQVQSDTQGEVGGLALNVQFDYAPAVYYTEGNSWTSTQIAAFDRAPQCDVEHLVGNQKAKAIQVTLVDSPPVVPSSTARGFSWATISIEVGVDDGGRYQNLPPGQRG